MVEVKEILDLLAKENGFQNWKESENEMDEYIITTKELKRAIKITIEKERLRTKKIIILAIITTVLFSGCVENQADWETVSIHAENEKDCLEIAEKSWNDVCPVLKANINCNAVWNSIQISYSPIEKTCYMKIPFEKKWF